MTTIDLRILNPDDRAGLPWPEVAAAVADDTPILSIEKAAVVADYTDRGNPGVLLIATGPDGKPVLLHTTATLFEMVAGAVRGACQKWGVPNW